MMTERRMGEVTFWNEGKGFGFVTDPEEGQDRFIHISWVTGSRHLGIGDRVSYRPVAGQKGPAARDVKVVY